MYSNEAETNSLWTPWFIIIHKYFRAVGFKGLSSVSHETPVGSCPNQGNGIDELGGGGEAGTLHPLGPPDKVTTLEASTLHSLGHIDKPN